MANELSARQERIVEQMRPLLITAPWILRVSDQNKKFTGIVLEICERVVTDKPPQQVRKGQESRLKEYGRIYNGALRTCLAPIQQMMMQMADEQGRPLEIHQLVSGRIAFRGKIPLNETIGAKLALLFKLHPQVRDEGRVELMAWRIERFSREETLYWLTKVSYSANGKRSIEWAKSGLRLMLAGQQKDVKEVDRLLRELRK